MNATSVINALLRSSEPSIRWKTRVQVLGDDQDSKAMRAPRGDTAIPTLYWHYDFLGGLKAMARIGRIRDARCAEALDLLEEKRLPAGGWSAEERSYKVSPTVMTPNADQVDWGGTSTKRMNAWVTVDALGRPAFGSPSR